MKKEKKFSLASMGVFLLLAVLPLFITNKYYNLTFSKFIFFISVTGAFFFMCLIFCDRVRKEIPKKKHRYFLQWLSECDRLALSFAAFLAVGFFSMLFSPYPYSSFCGYAGRYMGFDFVCAVFLLYFFVTRYYRLKDREIICFEVSGVLVILLALTEFFGFDPFGLMKTVPKESMGTFLSTLGNINVLASFIALLLPISMYYLTFFDKLKSIPIFITSTVFGYVGVFVSNSDSAYLALLAAFWIIGLMAFKKSESTYRFLLAFSLFWLSAFLFGVVHGISKKAFHLTDLTDYVTARWAIIPFFIFAAIALIVKYKPLSEKKLKIFRYAYIVVSVFAAVAVAFAIIYFSAFDTKTPLKGFLSYFRFNDSWGTDRGMVWKMGFSAFGKMPFINKLFGYGEDTIVVLFAKYFKQEMLNSGYYTDNAHNEYLQYLLTMGIFGLAAYISILFFSLKKLLKKSGDYVVCGAIAVSVFAYAVQAFVNISQPITTPIMFLFMAFAGCELKNSPVKGSHR